MLALISPSLNLYISICCPNFRNDYLAGCGKLRANSKSTQPFRLKLDILYSLMHFREKVIPAKGHYPSNKF